MSAALWGFAGTIVGGFVTLVATWWQQRHSAARDQQAFELAEAERRRAFEARTLAELRELLIVASSELDILRSSLRGKTIDQAAAQMVTWSAHHTRMLGLVWSVDDEAIRDAVMEAFRKMYGVLGTIGESSIDDGLSAASAAEAAAHAAIGARLRELA